MAIPFSELKEEALRLGLDDLGGVPAGDALTYPLYEEWLAAGNAGEMTYLQTREEARRHPASVLPGVKTIFAAVLSLRRLIQETEAASDSLRERLASCFAEDGSPQNSPDKPCGQIIPYAGQEDYHQNLRRKLKGLAAFLAPRFPGEKFRAAVDTAPILEKEWAVRAGLGRVGKNALLIHPRFGSALFLGILLTTASPDEFIGLPVLSSPFPPLSPASFAPPADDPCRDCSRCRDVCPVGALKENRTLAASQCLNYWLIEYAGREFPPEIREKLGNRVFGCDLCQRVCPKNPPTIPPFSIPRKRLATLSEDEFKTLFQGTPVFRLGRERLLRNAGLSPDGSES